MAKTREEKIKKFKKDMVIDEKRSPEEIKASVDKLEDYFITSGYLFDDLRIFRMEVYTFDVEHLHIPSVRCTIEPRGRKGLKLSVACDKLKLSFVRSVEKDGEHFAVVHGVCNIDLAKEVIKLIKDYDDKETTNPPE